MIRFNFEESELLNNFFADEDILSLTKEMIINRISKAKDNTEDKDLVNIAESLIDKLNTLNEDAIFDLLKDIPIAP